MTMQFGFFGEFRHNTDSKGRLILPSRFRELLGERFVITCGLDSCLEIASLEHWEERIRKLSQLPPNRKEHRQYLRIVTQGMQEVETDRLGRFTIPQNLREYAGIRKEVVINGFLLACK